MDEFYGEDMSQDRSSCYAVSKGLVSTAPGTTVQPQNAGEPCTSTDTNGHANGTNGTNIDDVGRGLASMDLRNPSHSPNECVVTH